MILKIPWRGSEKYERNGSVIIDTNILIYLSKYQLRPERVFTEHSAISVITKIEALGFNFKKPEENEILSAICAELKIIPITDMIVDQTISLRKVYKIKLADAIIYATALIEKIPLLTNNIKDFDHINAGVTIVNPFDL